MKTPEGELIGVLGIARDITARKKAEESLIEAPEKAQGGPENGQSRILGLEHSYR